MLGAMTLTGGLMAAGYMTYRRSSSRNSKVSSNAKAKPPGNRLTEWLGRKHKNEQNADQTKAADGAEVFTRHTDSASLFGLRTSAISLGLATIGTSVFPPLTYACIPTLIYMGIPPAQEAYESLQKDGHMSLALAETAALGICLAGGYLWAGSLGFCIYHLGRTLVSRHTEKEALPKTRHLPAEVVYRYENEMRVEVPVNALHKGDRISLETGEISPVTGVIVEGKAWLKAAALPQSGTEVWKEVGDQVHVMDVITIGRICVQVQNT